MTPGTTLCSCFKFGNFVFLARVLLSILFYLFSYVCIFVFHSPAPRKPQTPRCPTPPQRPSPTAAAASTRPATGTSLPPTPTKGAAGPTAPVSVGLAGPTAGPAGSTAGPTAGPAGSTTSPTVVVEATGPAGPTAAAKEEPRPLLRGAMLSASAPAYIFASALYFNLNFTFQGSPE